MLAFDPGTSIAIIGILNFIREGSYSTSIVDEWGIGLHNSSIGGRFFTSSSLIPFSFRHFLASFITSSFNAITPLFFVVGVGTGSGTTGSGVIGSGVFSSVEVQSS